MRPASRMAQGGQDLRVFAAADAEAAARQAAELIAATLREAVQRHGSAALALSGGRTPQRAWRLLGQQHVPWNAVQLAQVDERLAPGERNAAALRDALLSRVPLPPERTYLMPVDDPDPAAAAQRYAVLLQQCLGAPLSFDLIHLGLGADGHCASLVPGEPALQVTDRDVALTGPYQGARRMTLTYPVLNRARRIVWLVTGADKAAALRRLLAGDDGIPAGRVRREAAVLVADRAALATGDDS